MPTRCRAQQEIPGLGGARGRMKPGRNTQSRFGLNKVRINKNDAANHVRKSYFFLAAFFLAVFLGAAFLAAFLAPPALFLAAFFLATVRPPTKKIPAAPSIRRQSSFPQGEIRIRCFAATLLTTSHRWERRSIDLSEVMTRTWLLPQVSAFVAISEYFSTGFPPFSRRRQFFFRAPHEFARRRYTTARRHNMVLAQCAALSIARRWEPAPSLSCGARSPRERSSAMCARRHAIAIFPEEFVEFLPSHCLVAAPREFVPHGIRCADDRSVENPRGERIARARTDFIMRRNAPSTTRGVVGTPAKKIFLGRRIFSLRPPVWYRQSL